MLLRNSDWTRELLADMCAHAHLEDLGAMNTVRLCHMHQALSRVQIFSHQILNCVIRANAHLKDLDAMDAVGCLEP